MATSQAFVAPAAAAQGATAVAAAAAAVANYRKVYVSPHAYQKKNEKGFIVNPNKPQFNKTRATRVDQPREDVARLKDARSVEFKLNRQRASPLKLYQITRLINGLNAREALDQLILTPRKQARRVAKFLRSCMLNCENVHGLNADRLIIKEISVARGRIRKRIRPHGRSRFGWQRVQYCSMRMRLVEVPYAENERKLGKFGWKNATWAHFNEIAAEMEAQRKAEKEAAAAAAGGAGLGAPTQAEKEAADNMSDEELEKHFKAAMNKQHSEEEVKKAEEQLRMLRANETAGAGEVEEAIVEEKRETK